ncbi:hypothetical protein PN499_04965 [Kamptonema animale CS-326]|uniref:hypothetical protein n=1 Tax=Kamptonema animale TaxID=92934 RepID=UPI00232F6F02|nr:hypothetical protein [Kamptonema animale]MDB9510528.1 hypothetical protein [Kamptonema animale CS-326]
MRSVSWSRDGVAIASANGAMAILWHLDIKDLLRQGGDRVREKLKANPKITKSGSLCDGMSTPEKRRSTIVHNEIGNN